MADKNIGLRLRQVREDHKLSQEQLAEKMNVSQKTISSWEKDRTYPKVRELHRLCDIYDCTYDFLTGIKQYDSNDITMEDIMLKLATLNRDELERLKDHIKVLIHNQDEIARMTIERKKMEDEKKELEQKLKEYDRLIEMMNVQGIRREG